MPIPTYDLYETLARIGAQFVGDHVEIGSLHGKSAMVVARARPGAHIYCIDPLEKQMWSQEYQGYETGNSEVFMENIRHNELEDRITLIQEYSYPWPLPGAQLFSTALIDGCHTHPIPMYDFVNLAPIVQNAIVIDNVDLPGLIGCLAAVRVNKEWRLESFSRKVAVAWRKR